MYISYLMTYIENWSCVKLKCLYFIQTYWVKIRMELICLGKSMAGRRECIFVRASRSRDDFEKCSGSRTNKKYLENVELDTRRTLEIDVFEAGERWEMIFQGGISILRDSNHTLFEKMLIYHSN